MRTLIHLLILALALTASTSTIARTLDANSHQVAASAAQKLASGPSRSGAALDAGATGLQLPDSHQEIGRSGSATASGLVVWVHNANCGPKLSDPIPNLPKKVITEYDSIKLNNGTPRIDPATGQQTIHRGTTVMKGSRASSFWAGAKEWDVPGTSHRILEARDGTLGYVLNHDYSTIRRFPGPWFPDGG